MAETEKTDSESLAELEKPEIGRTPRDTAGRDDRASDSPDGIEGAGQDDAPSEGDRMDAPDLIAIKRKARSSVIASAVVIIAIGVALNWPLQYAETAVTTAPTLFVDFVPIETELPVMAGWPFRYRIHYSETENLPALNVFSVSALLRNVVLILCVLAVVCSYVYRRGRLQPVKSSKRFRLSIGDLLVLTVMVAIPFGGWQWLGRADERRKEIVAQLSREDGWVSQSAWIPEILIDRLPEDIIQKLRDIRGMRLENPEEETVRLAMDVPTLTRFRIGGGDYDLRILDRLAGSIHLRDVRVSGREIDADTIRLIASLKRLNTVNLMRTNVTTEALLALGALPDLRQLGVIHTEVNLAELGTPDWSDTIERFTMLHPDSGGSNEIVIEGWPNLTSIMISEYDTQLNAKPMKVRLADLPKLESVMLDHFQKFDLELSNLPALKKMVGTLYNVESRLPHGGAVPGALWLERFDGEGLPELVAMNFFCVDLKWFSLKGPTKISDLGAGVYYRSLNSNVRSNPDERKLSPESAKALIEGIGRSTGPIKVDLDLVPLAGVDLSPLANNQQLEHLLLDSSGTTIEQWRQFETMKWLKTLRISGNEIDSAGVKWALESFPNLQTLEYGVDPMARLRSGVTNVTFSMSGGDEKLELVGHSNLKSIANKGDQYAFQRSVRIIDMPKLEMAVDVDWPETFEIHNAPMLTGISVSGPLPPDISIDPLSNLDYFAVGGFNANDSVIELILDCQKIKTLTLAYASVSADVLAKLPLDNLNGLFLPGCAVDDQVVEQWPTINSLTHLNLADTKISADSLPKILASPSLQSLTLDRCPIQASDLVGLKDLSTLTELSVAGIGTPPATLAHLLKETELRVIDLSDTDVPNEVMDAIVQHGTQIQHLSLRNAKFDNKRLFEALKKHRSFCVDTEGSYLETQLHIALINARRLKTRDEWRELIYRNQIDRVFVPGNTTATSTVQYDYKPAAMIPVENFASGGMYSPESMSGSGQVMLGGPTAIQTTSGGSTTTAGSIADSTGSWIDGVIGNFFGADPVDEIATEEAESVQVESTESDPSTTSGDNNDAPSDEEESR